MRIATTSDEFFHPCDDLAPIPVRAKLHRTGAAMHGLELVALKTAFKNDKSL
jgi:hypothetical protein